MSLRTSGRDEVWRFKLEAGKTITTVLSDGVHEVTATASLDGATAQDTVSITVGEAVTAPVVSVTSLHQGPDDGRHVIVDVHIDDDAGKAVAGAEVSAEIWHANPDATPTALREAVSATTDTHGHVNDGYSAR